MSSSEEDKKVVVQTAPSVAPVGSTVQVVQAQPVAAAGSGVSHSETIVTHTSTNTGALFATALGVIVLVVGTGLIYSQIKFLPWPYSIISVLGLGLILVVAGASFIGKRT
jgi:hypothetical protein